MLQKYFKKNLVAFLRDNILKIITKICLRHSVIKFQSHVAKYLKHIIEIVIWLKMRQRQQNRQWWSHYIFDIGNCSKHNAHSWFAAAKGPVLAITLWWLCVYGPNNMSSMCRYFWKGPIKSFWYLKFNLLIFIYFIKIWFLKNWKHIFVWKVKTHLLMMHNLCY